MGTVQLRGKELCWIINDALRSDARPALTCAAKVLLALRPLALAGNNGRVPPGGRVYRGGCLPVSNRGFFTEGKCFRTPSALATCFSEEAAQAFAQRRAAPGDDRPAIVWTVIIGDVPDPRIPAYVLDSSGELLFSPYARFRVEHAEWREIDGTYAADSLVVSAFPDLDVESKDA